MFTGLVEELGQIHAVARRSQSVRITVGAQKVLGDAKIGDSIAVNGVCLTVVTIGDRSFTADVMPETFERTTLSLLKSGDKVNLERTLRLCDRLGGHIVSGHVDVIGRIETVIPKDIANIICILVPPEHGRMIIPQGSVAVDGISLTVVNSSDDRFSVSLIPHTWSATALNYTKPGDAVNIETDVIGKYVRRLVMGGARVEEKGKSEVSVELLAKYGFCD